MSRRNAFLAGLLAAGTALAWSSACAAADEPAKVAGTWEMTAQGRRGTRTQTLVFQQDGSTIKGTIKGPRGEAPLEGTVEGSKITFTVTRETPNGSFTIEYTGTLEGDSLKGTFHSERFDGEWTAKRASGGAEK
ncbi:MAG: hypothetical protein ACE145_17285 [Terriglobia bacterium]